MRCSVEHAELKISVRGKHMPFRSHFFEKIEDSRGSARERLPPSTANMVQYAESNEALFIRTK
jgi:hypothetical protein